MPIFLCFLFFLTYSASACDRCAHQTKAAYFTWSGALSIGACGYGSSALDFNGGYLAGGARSLYRDGVGCGACLQVRCKDMTLCSRGGTEVILFDLNESYETGIVLSKKAFVAMAREGMGDEIVKLGIVDVEYKRVPCDYENQKLSVRVEEMSRKPDYLAIKFLYQGGQTDIVGVDVAQVDSSNWVSMNRNYGAVWDASRVPTGPLQFRIAVTSGYDGKSVWTKKVLPADWNAGNVYDSDVQIDDIAQEGCSPCDVGAWK